MLRVRIDDQRTRREVDHAAGPLEFGRIPRRGARRIVLDDPHVSRDQLRVTERAGGLLHAENLSRRAPVILSTGAEIPIGGDLELEMPVRMTIGMTTLEFDRLLATAPPPTIESWQTIQQPLADRTIAHQQLNLAGIGDAVTPETLAHWFETVLSVQRAAAGSAEFYEETAKGIVNLVGLDLGMVLLRQRRSPAETDDGTVRTDEWEPVATYTTEAGSRARFSRTILARMVQERRTFYRAAEIVQSTGSLEGVEAVVVSPIFDAEGDVAGALYGLRVEGEGRMRPGIRPLEAQVVQLLAAAVGSGLARLVREAEAARSRIQFEQFFSSALASELQRDPKLLDGRDREVTILFSDIRGFSGLSEQLGPVDTFKLVGDVMEQLTARIQENAGTLVSYIGDGLLAMWNAPLNQPDHAMLACRAALDMVEALPQLNVLWQDRVGKPLRLGIGINTGNARVGNTGSSRRFNYAPLGHTVNLASRVEGATKYLGVPVLITGSTQQRIGREMATRRLCQARLAGMSTPVHLFELHSNQPDNAWIAQRDAYEESLKLYEAGQFAEACRAIYPLLEPDKAVLAAVTEELDVPSLTLVGRAVECLKSPPDQFDPVFEFGGK